MSNFSLDIDLIDKFKIDFEKELYKIEKKAFGVLVSVNHMRVREIALYLLEKGGNFLNIVINDEGEKFELIYQFYFQLMKIKFWFVKVLIDKEVKIDSIEIIYPHAKYIELELTKRYSLEFNRLSEDTEKELFAVPLSLYTKNSTKNVIPIGIYNSVHKSHYYFNFQVEKEKIISVTQKTGWLYRGITPLMKYKNIFEENLRLTKRICANSFHHSLAYITAIEQLTNVKVEKRAEMIRTLICELERFGSHLLWFANLFFLLDYKRKYKKLLKLRLDLNNLFLKRFKNENLEDFNYIGYTQDINVGSIPFYHNIFTKTMQSIYDLIYNTVYKKYVKDICQGIGVLEKGDAVDAGVTGPCLRASGIVYDVRLEKPYLSYSEKQIAQVWDVVTFKEGDVYARTETRLWEMNNSKNIVLRLLEELINDTSEIKAIDMSKHKMVSNETNMVQLENPQGELLYYVKCTSIPSPPVLRGIYICTPSFKNFCALNEYILKGSNVKDLRLIVHSMDLNFNEIDL